MRREGRQHGMLSMVLGPSAPSNDDDVGKKSRKRIYGPFMGQFTKSPSKPTNSSKFTSRCRLPRCGICHDHPVNKARAKTKGNHRYKDDISDFYVRGDCKRSKEAGEVNYDSDESGGSDGGEELICREGGGGGRGDGDDEGWVMVERV